MAAGRTPSRGARLPRLVQTTKTAASAAIAWWLAVRIFGAREPYFAPLAAVLTLQVTVAETISRGAQRLLGVVGGIALSLLVAHFLPIGPLAVGLLVLLGMGTALLAGFGPQAVSQIAVSALLVMALKGKPGYAAMRMVETLLGAAVAVLVNAFVLPPTGVREARAAVAALVEEISDDLSSLAQNARIDPSGARGTLIAEERARAAVAALEESLEYNPLARTGRRRARELRSGVEHLRRVAGQVRGMARTLGEVSEGRHRLLSEVLDAAAKAMRAYGAWLLEGEPAEADGRRALIELRSRNQRLMRLIGRGDPEVVRASSVLADLVKLSEDIRMAEDPPMA